MPRIGSLTANCPARPRTPLPLSTTRGSTTRIWPSLRFAPGASLLGCLTDFLWPSVCWGMSIILSMVWISSRHGVHPLASWSLMLLVASNLQAFFPLRPQLLSFGLCSLALMLLDRAFCHWHEHRRVRWRLLAVLPALFVVWINSHGAVVAGLCIVGAYLVGRIIELLIKRRPINWTTACGLAAAGLACAAATLANPYGLELHRWLAASLGQPRPEITEWAGSQGRRPHLLALDRAADRRRAEFARHTSPSRLGADRHFGPGGLAIGFAPAAHCLSGTVVRLLAPRHTCNRPSVDCAPSRAASCR